MIDENRALIDSLNKKLAMLDDKIKSIARGGIGGGGAANAGL